MKHRAWHVLLALTMTSVAASAAESAYDFTVCTHSRYIPLEANADIVSFGVENWGVVSSSTTKAWENASTHCVGYIRILGGKLTGKGTCRWLDAGGDSAVGEWEYPSAGDPAWTWLSGTGKFKGISGGGTFKELFNAPSSTAGTGQGCRRDWGRMNLP